MGGGVGETEEAGFVVLPAEGEFAVDDALGQWYGVGADDQAAWSDLRVVVGAAALGRDHDVCERVLGEEAQAQRRTAGSEVRDGAIGQPHQQLDGYSGRAGQQFETARGEQVSERRELHRGESGFLWSVLLASGLEQGLARR